MKTLLLILFLIHALPASAQDDRTIRMEISVPAGSELGREVIEMYKALFQKHNYAFVALDLPPVRGIEELKRGKIDGTVGRTSNIAAIYGLKHYTRLDEPLMYLTFSLWCRQPIPTLVKQGKIRLGTYRGSIVSTRIVDQADQAMITPILLNNYKIALSMVKRERLDCIVGSEAVMDSEGSSLEGLENFHRHNLVTSAIYPWISQRLLPLKTQLEKDIAAYRFSERWEKKFRYQKATCRNDYDWICPDGQIFKKAVDLR